MTDFSELKGQTLRNVIQIGDDVLRFESVDGKTYELNHHQNCCENVVIESIIGDFEDLVDTPILLAEEATSDTSPADFTGPEDGESQTWTFYKLRTIKGSVDIRWHGTSNGYYSEKVDFDEVKNDH